MGYVAIFSPLCIKSTDCSVILWFWGCWEISLFKVGVLARWIWNSDATNSFSIVIFCIVSENMKHKKYNTVIQMQEDGQV